MNALEMVKRVLNAEETALKWPTHVQLRVQELKPAALVATPREWRTTVEAFRTDMEFPEAGAARLALYLTLHQEAYGDTPRLDAVRADGLRQD